MIKKTALLLIKIYKRALSPMLNQGYRGCRFYPSCADYAHEAIDKKGVLKGVFLAIKRFLRCNPLSEGGVDPVRD